MEKKVGKKKSGSMKAILNRTATMGKVLIFTETVKSILANGRMANKADMVKLLMIKAR